MIYDVLAVEATAQDHRYIDGYGTMTEAEACALSNGYFNCASPRAGWWLVGYLPFRAVNPLLATKRYALFRVDFWGYIMERRLVERGAGT